MTTLYIPSADGNMYAFDTTDGSMKWAKGLDFVYLATESWITESCTGFCTLNGAVVVPTATETKETCEARTGCYRLPSLQYLNSRGYYDYYAHPPTNQKRVPQESCKTENMNAWYIASWNPHLCQTVRTFIPKSISAQAKISGVLSKDILTLYTICGSSVCALNTEDGTIKWTSSGISVHYTTPTLSADGLTVYVIASSNDDPVLRAYALNASNGPDSKATDGSQKWKSADEVGEASSVLSMDGSTMFCGNKAVNTSDGTTKWTAHDVENTSTTSVLSEDGMTLYVGSDNKNVYALNASDGSTIWTFAAESVVSGTPALSPDGKTLYVNSQNYVYSLNGVDGQMLWKTFTISGGKNGRFASALSPDGSSLYVGSTDNNVYALNAADGTKKWSYLTEGHAGPPTVSKDGKVLYVGSADQKVYAIHTGA
jgi:outer membrane protein assembly factor BamB